MWPVFLPTVPRRRRTGGASAGSTMTVRATTRRSGGERAREEDVEVPVESKAETAAGTLPPCAEHEGQYEGCRLVAVFFMSRPTTPKARHDHDVPQRCPPRVHADDAEEQDEGKEETVRHAQELDPEADQGAVQDEQDHVAHVHARDDAPEHSGARGSEGPGWTP